ncbi:MAG: serB [Anaerophaga sp.]|uniref:phosphoserine phosphatase SerB n=1 Tax=Anaerophaga thermohalophila TaxID=177400 RepID=UPI000237CDE2|nr:phosphoserine phosphatase SerB [Anaerophaga thermohalophila]MBZ4676641.1 serB [Anaerophaga sp.]MDI3520887.1 phosphoserine phosphatase [Anaerophaga sp.]MDN5290621.1 phosphoserine phosphatase [Anaerophaga sp.]
MSHKREVILLNISGEDKPGQTAALTGILAQYNVNILDIGQAVIHQDLGLGILFEVPAKSESSPILKDILFKAYEIGLNVKFTPVSEEQYEDWVNNQGKERYIITLLSPKLTARQLAAVTKEISDQKLNIDIISRLSGRIPLDEPDGKTKSVVEFSVRGTPADIEKMKTRFIEITGTSGVDIAFQEDNIYRRNRRLICFDMDSTLIQTEVIDELARKAGVYDKVSAITESAMRGEIDFNESFKQRVALLKGLDESVMKEVAESLPLTEGAERLFKTLKKYGYRTAILSGGFTYFGNHLKNKLNIDYVFANELEIKDGKLTGRHIGEIINGQKKAELLKLLAFKEDINLAQVIAVGDGSNDLPMLREAGLGIAFHAKPKVKASAKHAISTIGLDAILYLLGFRDREINQ